MFSLVKTKLFRHYNLFITLLMGYKPISVLATFNLCYNESKVYCYNESKIYRRYIDQRKYEMTIRNPAMISAISKTMFLELSYRKVQMYLF